MAISGFPNPLGGSSQNLISIISQKINDELQSGGLINSAILAETNVLTEDLSIASNTTYDIDPDVDVVVLKNGDGSTGAIVNLPNITYQTHGKRLLILSDMDSTNLNISHPNGYLGLPQVTSVVDGDSFEFATVKDGVSSHWIRIN